MPMYFLNIDKEKGMTSFDVIYRLRKILKIKKIGHSGTLDPMATGVMQVAVGSATKLLDYLDGKKGYVATLKFGEISSTYDIEGEKTFIKKPDFTKEELEGELRKFKGEILQVPPLFSAIKINGKKLYEYARNKEKPPEVKPRLVEIYKIELLSFKKPDVAEILIECSKGTYIRSIARDLGENLTCGAHLTDLRRIQAGNFKIENSIKIQENIENFKIDPKDVLDLNLYKLSDVEFERIKHGNPIKTEIKPLNDKKFMLEYNNKLVSIANLKDNTLKVEKVFETE